MPELYITSVGKNKSKIQVTTGISATLQSLGYSNAIYKPVETGVIDKFSKDISFIKYVDPFIQTFFTYQLEKDFSPLVSGAFEGLLMEKDAILKDYQKIQENFDYIITDGISGLATPISKNFLEEDIIMMLDLPLLLVVSAKNEDLNNIILSINRANEKHLELRGVVINEYPKENKNPNIKLLPKLIEEYTDAKTLGIIPEFSLYENPENLIFETIKNVNIEEIFNIRIAKLNTF